MSTDKALWMLLSKYGTKNFFHSWKLFWREERRRSLENLFARREDKVLLKEISSLLKEWSKDPRLLSAEQDKFQSNICLFVEARTGRKGLQYREAIQMLREMSFSRNEQSKILYEAIEKQRTEIALQQQMITCLEYRFALEHLPQMDTSEMKTMSKPSATSAWQRMWTLAVEGELEKNDQGLHQTSQSGTSIYCSNHSPSSRSDASSARDSCDPISGRDSVDHRSTVSQHHAHSPCSRREVYS